MPTRKQKGDAEWESLKDLCPSKRAPAMLALFKTGRETTLEDLLQFEGPSHTQSVVIGAINLTKWRPPSHGAIAQLFPTDGRRRVSQCYEDRLRTLIAWYKVEPQAVDAEMARGILSKGICSKNYSELLRTLYKKRLLTPLSQHMRDLDPEHMDLVLSAAYRAGFPVDYAAPLAPLAKPLWRLGHLAVRQAWRLKKLTPTFEQTLHYLPLLADAYRHGLQPTDAHMTALSESW